MKKKSSELLAQTGIKIGNLSQAVASMSGGQRQCVAISRAAGWGSKLIVMDGEGASKFITIKVSGAKSKKSAKIIAFSIANSPLVKTAIAGQDANWGRIIAKLGSVDGVNFIPSKVKLFINGILLFENETNAKIVNHKKLESSMKNKKIKIDLFLNNGSQSYTIKTSDLSKQYVHLNSAYPS